MREQMLEQMQALMQHQMQGLSLRKEKALIQMRGAVEGRDTDRTRL